MSQVFSIEPIVMMNNFGFKTQTQFLDILGDNSRVVVIIFLDIVPRLLLVLAQVMYGGEFLLADCTGDLQGHLGST